MRDYLRKFESATEKDEKKKIYATLKHVLDIHDTEDFNQCVKQKSWNWIIDPTYREQLSDPTKVEKIKDLAVVPTNEEFVEFLSEIHTRINAIKFDSDAAYKKEDKKLGRLREELYQKIKDAKNEANRNLLFDELKKNAKENYDKIDM